MRPIITSPTSGTYGNFEGTTVTNFEIVFTFPKTLAIIKPFNSYVPRPL